MFCISCHNTNTHVANSRPHKKDPKVWRRRHCPACGVDFTTQEKPVLDLKVYVLDRKSGTQQPFSQGKLIHAIMQSFIHDEQLGITSALPLSETVIAKLLPAQGGISTAAIAYACYDVLARFDKLAAIQYALRHGIVAAPKRRRKRA